MKKYLIGILIGIMLTMSLQALIMIFQDGFRIDDIFQNIIYLYNRMTGKQLPC